MTTYAPAILALVDFNWYLLAFLAALAVAWVVVIAAVVEILRWAT